MTIFGMIHFQVSARACASQGAAMCGCVVDTAGWIQWEGGYSSRVVGGAGIMDTVARWGWGRDHGYSGRVGVGQGSWIQFQGGTGTGCLTVSPLHFPLV